MRRQHSVENYILDFFCYEEMLGIELDGQVHFTAVAMENDAIRTERLNQLGIKVIRFENKMVFENLHGVLDEIKANFRK